MAETNNSRTSFARRIITTQLIVDVALWLSVSLPVLYLFLRGRPHVVGFFCDDPTLSFPFRTDTISTTVLVAVGFATSIVLIVLVEALNFLDSKCRRTCQNPGRITHCVKAYAVFLVGFTVEELFVDVIKNNLGVLRPNFFDVCRPDYNNTLCPGYVTEYTCTGNDIKEILRSRQSFPSGHSTFSMYGAVFFCIYVQHSLHIKFSRILKFFVQTALIFVAALCGLGRIKDNKHHPSDVIGGFVLGSTVAVLVWKMLGNKVLKLNKVYTDGLPTGNNQSKDRSRDCCSSCGQSPEQEPQTPSPLLPNEFIYKVGNGQMGELCKGNNLINEKSVHLAIPCKWRHQEENA